MTLSQLLRKYHNPYITPLIYDCMPEYRYTDIRYILWDKTLKLERRPKIGPRSVRYLHECLIKEGIHSELCKPKDHTKREVRMLTLNGETMSLCKWAKRIKMSPGGLKLRLDYGWTVEEALTIPIGQINIQHKRRKARALHEQGG